jgi:NitT/TauT family transport system permease protein
MFENLFKLRGELSSQQKLVFGILGFLIFIGLWALMAELLSEQGLVEVRDSTTITDTRYVDNDTIMTAVIPPAIKDSTLIDSLAPPPETTYRIKEIIDADSLKGEDLDLLMAMSNEDLTKYGLEVNKTYVKLPQPWKIITAIPVLISKYDLIEHTGKSLWVNLLSYALAILISLPLGFALGLIPLVRGLFGRIFDAFRFIPLAAVTFIFILWFGIEMQMKIAFLAFGILVYLVPVVVQRIDEVKEVYLKTVFTLGATNWQTIKTVYIPSVISRLSDDIRVLTAISWTYITVAEMLNNTGGLGGLIFRFRRQSNIEYAFVVLIVIIIIGILQDYILRLLDKILFPYKYVERGHG